MIVGALAFGVIRVGVGKTQFFKSSGMIRPLEAILLAGNVVFPIALDPTAGPSGRAAADPTLAAPPGHRAWPALSKTTRELLEARALTAPLPALVQPAKNVGHTLAPADPDGLVR